MPGAPTPPLIQEAFGTSAGASYITNPIPVPSQIGIKIGAASYTDGFPPLTMTPEGSGGVPMFGQDMNGILYALSSNLAALTGGQLYAFSSVFASANGGYAAGAILSMASGTGFWLNIVNGNSNNPDTTAAATSGWVPLAGYGSTTVSGLTGGTTTLTATQAAAPQLLLNGTLTSNLQLIFPTWLKSWRVINNTTGNFTVTCKTASGTGVPALQFGSTGFTEVYGDGTNINFRTNYAVGTVPSRVWTGFASDPGIGVTYLISDNMVRLSFGGTISTSNSSDFILSNLPLFLTNNCVGYCPILGLVDNGAVIPSGVVAVSTDGQFKFFKDALQTGWTASGMKGTGGVLATIYAPFIQYKIS